MKNNLLNKSKKYVDDAYGEKKSHFQNTLEWLLKLNPNTDEAMQIAAYCHDIERAFDKDKGDKCFRIDKNALKKHQENGGKIMYDFLTKNCDDEKLAAKVKHLISCHEWGGDKDQDLIQAADSLSFLEKYSERKQKMTDRFSKKEMLKKLEFMFERIRNKEAKKIAKPMYQKTLKIVEEEYETNKYT